LFSGLPPAGAVMMVITSSGTGSFSDVSVLYFSQNVGGVWVVLALILSGDGEGEVTEVAGEGKGHGVVEGPDASGDGEEGVDPKAGGFFFLVLFIKKVIYVVICKLTHAGKIGGLAR